METVELFYPDIGVQLGSWTLEKGIEIEVYSDGKSYFDWAKVRFTPEFQDVISIEKKEAGSISLGYDNVLEEIFLGYVTKTYNNSGSMDEILLKD